MIDTGASYSSIRQGDASWLFGLGPQSPGAEIVGTTIAADGASLTSYRVPFKSLEVAASPSAIRRSMSCPISRTAICPTGPASGRRARRS
ncbi:MAG: hypothetical protein WDN69_02465 [Aliidongia sp.]